MKRTRSLGNGRALRACLLMTALLGAVALTGCGGGGSSKSVSKTPTKAVRDHVKLLHNQAFSALAQSGVNSSALTAMRDGGFSTGGIGGGNVALASGTASNAPAAPADNSNHASGPPVPLLGQFLHNVAGTKKSVRAHTIHAMQTRHVSGARLTRDDSNSGSSGGSPSDPPVPDPTPLPTFYFDDYLGLWVDIADTPTSSTYSLYEDEAKTKPAGSIVTQIPTDDMFPQVYSSTYSFTAGYQNGSHGNYQNTFNQDNSGSSSYLDVYTDGSKDQGSSVTTARGDFTWTGRTDNADKTYTSERGTFHPDGSGATHSEGSDGYVSDYIYNANGSGHARITGPDPGLPATIDWDAAGNTTIRYADGSSDFIPGWGYGTVEPVAADGSVGASGSGTTSSGTVTGTTTPPETKAAHKTVH